MVTITLSAAGTKKAASRLREFLASVGISLKQTHAYEALAQALGYANWNTLQAQLDPAAMPKTEASPRATAPIDSLPSALNAAALARELADAGCDLLIAAGGDGTLNEVVNGILVGSSDARSACCPWPAAATLPARSVWQDWRRR